MLATKKKVLNKVKSNLKKVITKFKPSILSRHPTHSILRTSLNLQPCRSIVRLGSTTTKESWNNNRTKPLTREQLSRVVEINTVQGVKNSASKLLMKQCFTEAEVKTAKWWLFNREGVPGLFFKEYEDDSSGIASHALPYPIIAKSHYGSRGEGNTKLDNQEALEAWMRGKDLSNYIFEQYMPYSREYRLHVTDEGCFYTCRKLVRNDAPEGTWQRHDDVCTWVLETNPSFKKPNNWNAIVADCIRAKNALGLDICAFDVLVQGGVDGRERINPEWLLLESCSAPSFGEITGQKYIIELNKLILNKSNNLHS